MKKLFITLLVLIVLVIGGVFAAVYFVPLSEIQQLVKEAVHEETGRDIDFTSAEIKIFPNLALRLDNVSLSNASWAKEKNMVQLETLDVQLALKPLFDSRIVVDRFILQSPVINLEIAPSGKGNWEFDVKETASDADGDDDHDGKGDNDFSFTLGTFRIVDGLFTLTDHKNKKVETVKNIDIDVDFPDLKSALKVDGGLEYKGKRVTLALALKQPMALSMGASSEGSMHVETEDMSADVTGRFASTGTLLKGTIDANVTSLSKLVAWAVGGAAQDLPFEKISFKSQAKASATRFELKGAALSLDDIQAQGDVTVGYAAKPSIWARLSIGALDLNKFVSASTNVEEKTQATTQTVKTDWDNTRIDFSGLKSVDVDLVLDTQGFSLQGAKVGPSRLIVLLNDGKLNVSSSEATLFGGAFSSSLMLNAARSTPDMAFTFKMAGVKAKPVLTTFADFENLSGNANARVSVTSIGNSQKAIINNLNGQGDVIFKNGALEGIDLANIAQMVQQRLSKMEIGAGKTEFVDLGGTFTITKGVVNNSDFKMRGPLVQASGAGSVNLPMKYIKYRVTPLLTASSAEADAGGISIPVNIKGPFHKIKIKPDYKSVIKGVLDNPDQALGTLKSQGKVVEDIFQNVKKDPAKALEGLLGGGLFGSGAQ